MNATKHLALSPTCGVYGPGVMGSRHSRSAASKAASFAVEMSFSSWVKCSSYWCIRARKKENIYLSDCLSVAYCCCCWLGKTYLFQGLLADTDYIQGGLCVWAVLACEKWRELLLRLRFLNTIATIVRWLPLYLMLLAWMRLTSDRNTSRFWYLCFEIFCGFIKQTKKLSLFNSVDFVILLSVWRMYSTHLADVLQIHGAYDHLIIIWDKLFVDRVVEWPWLWWKQGFNVLRKRLSQIEKEGWRLTSGTAIIFCVTMLSRMKEKATWSSSSSRGLMAFSSLTSLSSFCADTKAVNRAGGCLIKLSSHLNTNLLQFIITQVQHGLSHLRYWMFRTWLNKQTNKQKKEIQDKTWSVTLKLSTA